MLAEFIFDEKRYLRLARFNYYAAQGLLWASLAASSLAALLGLVPSLSAAIEKWQLGLASALSVLFTTFSQQVGFQQRANWHYRSIRAQTMRDCTKKPSPLRHGLSSEGNGAFENGGVEKSPIAEGRAIEASHRTDSGPLKASPVTECGALKAHPAVEVCGVEFRRGVEGRAFKTCLSTEIYTAGEAGILAEGGAAEVGPVAEGCTGEAGVAWFEDVSSAGSEQINATPFAL